MEPCRKIDPTLAARIFKIVRHAETESPVIDAGWMLIDGHKSIESEGRVKSDSLASGGQFGA